MKTKKRKNLWMPIAFVFAVWLSILSYMIYDTKNVGITKYEITNKKIPKAFNSFRIAQISDFHSGNFDRDNKKILSKLEECKPDIIVITGDFFEGTATDHSLCFDLIAQIVGMAPTYYVSGNHEWNIKYYKKLKLQLKSYGVIILEDEAVSISKEDDKINLIGINDITFHKERRFEDVEQRIEKLINKDDYNILLSHRPERFEEYCASGVDLALTGHAHGGQFRFPFIGGLYAPHQGFFPKYDKGMYEKENTTMVVSRGLGNSVIPLRFNNHPEIVLVELKN